jgi:hypothetical protein
MKITFLSKSVIKKWFFCDATKSNFLFKAVFRFSSSPHFLKQMKTFKSDFFN